MLKVAQQDKIKLIDPLFHTDRRFWTAVFFLSTIIGWGVLLYIEQIKDGLIITGMNRPAYWGLYMVNFIFFIGISLAGTLTSAILRITGVEWRRPITRLAETITVCALLIAGLQIIIDMGRPDRLLNVILYGRLQSPILWDVAIITTYLLSSVTYLFLPLIPDIAIIRDNMPEDAPRWQALLYRLLAFGWRGNIEQWRRLEKFVSFMAIFIVPVGVAVHTITSWLLATTVQPGWHSTVFGPYFVVTAVFSGIAALFIVMTIVRYTLELEDYITLKQYRGLGWLFITMAIIWGYFTYTETLTLIAGQQLLEFPVLASKLWGEHAFTFWLMLLLIGGGCIVVLLSRITSPALLRVQIIRPRYVIVSACLAVTLILMLLDPQVASAVDRIAVFDIRAFGWALVFLLLIIVFLGLSVWFMQHPVITAVIGGSAVIVGAWLERWNIVVPTLTHPRLIDYSIYTPTITEIGITIASIALFILLFVLFFKFFPAVSIWEIAEGRVIDEAQSAVSIPIPQSSAPIEKQRWTFR
jgi:molybdopterin-containing oxidoreductase family membrane subunit